MEEGDRYDCRHARRHHRNLPERTDPRRARTASGRTPRRAALVRARGLHQVFWVRYRAPQDRNTSATAPQQHRLRRRGRSGDLCRGVRRRRAGPVFVFHVNTTSKSNPMLVAPHQRTHPRSCSRRTSTAARCTTGRFRASVRAYCPSLEDKIMRFPDRERHQLYLEPEGLDVDEIYVNGLSMSLPLDVQEQLVHSLPGLEQASILRAGYAVEYDFVQPTELKSTLETQRVGRTLLCRTDQRHLWL